jgi:hypothetical protein
MNDLKVKEHREYGFRARGFAAPRNDASVFLRAG